MHDVIVKRSKWLRGTYDSYLSVKIKGKIQRCCLGFAGLTCGLKDKEMNCVVSPYDQPIAFEKLFPELLIRTSTGFGDNSPICYQLMELNDVVMTDSVREKELML